MAGPGSAVLTVRTVARKPMEFYFSPVTLDLPTAVIVNKPGKTLFASGQPGNNPLIPLRFMFKVILCLAVVVASSALPEAVEITTAIKDKDWEEYKHKFKKTYKDADDEKKRHSLFNVAKARVAELNKLNGSPAFGINWMSDRYPHEQHKKGLVKPASFVPTAEVLEAEQARKPKAVDWRLTEAVTPIKNQGQCGSCWAFSATEAIESQMILGTGGKVALTLSPQQIASCAPSTGQYGCLGCNGGFTEGAYEYVKSATGLANSDYIPYAQSLTASEPTKACMSTEVQQLDGPMQQLTGGYATVSGYHYAVKPCTGMCTGEHQNLKALAAALEKSPVSVCVNAGVWNDYTGGVMSADACGAMGAASQDHCVMAVGFNAKAPTPYWIVRNSWASTWGEDGYVYLEMAKNTCGLANDVTVPEVKLGLLNETEVAIRREGMYKRATA